MTADPTTQIAGRKTIADWIAFRTKLKNEKGKALWQQAGTDYFYKRVQTRYTQPIRILRYSKMPEGEGFSIVTLQCALIEFLAATVLGKNYRYPAPSNEFEYSKSKLIFEAFLSSNPPFSNSFSRKTAGDFYLSVRCGLLHEARTKDGWRIRTEKAGVGAVDPQMKIVYRNTLQNDLERFVKLYRKNLLTDACLQNAFIRKFDHLADLSLECAAQ
jgi:hypothetical protein